MRVRLNRQERRVDRNTIRVFNPVVRHARRDVDVLLSQPDHHRGASRCLVREEEPDAHLHGLPPVRGTHVELHDEIAVGVEPPRRVPFEERRKLSRRPAEELPVREFSAATQPAVEAGSRVRGIVGATRACAVDADVRVMDDAWIVGTELEPAHVVSTRQPERDDEISQLIGPSRLDDIRLGHRDHGIGLAEPPPVGEPRGDRKIGRRSLRRTVGDPSVDRRNFSVAQTPRAGEFRAVDRVGFPWGHRARSYCPGDGSSTRARVRKREQAETTDFTGTMTRGAVLEEDGCDVVRERSPFLGGGTRRKLERHSDEQRTGHA